MPILFTACFTAITAARPIPPPVRNGVIAQRQIATPLTVPQLGCVMGSQVAVTCCADVAALTGRAVLRRPAFGLAGRFAARVMDANHIPASASHAVITPPDTPPQPQTSSGTRWKLVRPLIPQLVMRATRYRRQIAYVVARHIAELWRLPPPPVPRLIRPPQVDVV